MKTDIPLDSPDTPPIFTVFLILVSIFFFVFMIWILLYPLLSQVTDKLQSESERGMANKTRLLYIHQQDDYLKSAGKLENGIQKISIEQAMNDVIQNQKESK